MTETQESGKDPLSDEELQFAADYVRRWRNWHPDLDPTVKDEIREALAGSAVMRGVVGALLRYAASPSGNSQ